MCASVIAAADVFANPTRPLTFMKAEALPAPAPLVAASGTFTVGRIPAGIGAATDPPDGPAPAAIAVNPEPWNSKKHRLPTCRYRAVPALKPVTASATQPVSDQMSRHAVPSQVYSASDDPDPITALMPADGEGIPTWRSAIEANHGNFVTTTGASQTTLGDPPPDCGTTILASSSDRAGCAGIAGDADGVPAT